MEIQRKIKTRLPVLPQVGNSAGHHSDMDLIKTTRSRKTTIRRLTPTECRSLQTIPKWYVFDCSDSQQYKMLGNGWCIDQVNIFFQYLSKYFK
jgi:site-specific DNA-cytosine methylase